MPNTQTEMGSSTKYTATSNAVTYAWTGSEIDLKARILAADSEEAFPKWKQCLVKDRLYADYPFVAYHVIVSLEHGSALTTGWYTTGAVPIRDLMLAICSGNRTVFEIPQKVASHYDAEQDKYVVNITRSLAKKLNKKARRLQKPSGFTLESVGIESELISCIVLMNYSGFPNPTAMGMTRVVQEEMDYTLGNKGQAVI